MRANAKAWVSLLLILLLANFRLVAHGQGASNYVLLGSWEEMAVSFNPNSIKPLGPAISFFTLEVFTKPKFEIFYRDGKQVKKSYDTTLSVRAVICRQEENGRTKIPGSYVMFTGVTNYFFNGRMVEQQDSYLDVLKRVIAAKDLTRGYLWEGMEGPMIFLYPTDYEETPTMAGMLNKVGCDKEYRESLIEQARRDGRASQPQDGYDCSRTSQYYQNRYERDARVSDYVCMQRALMRELGVQ